MVARRVATVPDHTAPPMSGLRPPLLGEATAPCGPAEPGRRSAEAPRHAGSVPPSYHWSMKLLAEAFAITVSASAMVIAGCGKEAPPPRLPASGGPGGTAPPPAVAPAVAGAPGGAISIGNLVFTVPEGWVNAPPSNAMRLAELVVPDPGNDANRRCVAAFSRAGGDVQTNIDRWSRQVLDAAGQPTAPTVSTATVSGRPVHLVELTGAFQDGMPGGALTPRENWMLRGAIVEAGDGLVFIKMTGPVDAMNACSAGWKTLIDGMAAR